MDLPGIGRCILAFVCVTFPVSRALADSIAVVDPSFESVPAGGFPGVCSGGGDCYYSTGSIAGWTGTGQFGQVQPGTQNGWYGYFNYLPDGITSAWLNSGTLTQITSADVQVGVTYTLQVDLGVAKVAPDPGSIYLMIGSKLIQATGTMPSSGNWSVYTATYTGLSADAGSAIGIELATSGVQGEFDNVLLTDTSSVPEPASALLLAGCLGVLASRLRFTRR